MPKKKKKAKFSSVYTYMSAVIKMLAVPWHTISCVTSWRIMNLAVRIIFVITGDI